VVDEDEALEYYKSYELVVQITIIGPYIIKSLLKDKECQVIAILIEDIIAQHKKDDVKEKDLRDSLPNNLKSFTDVFSSKAANTLLLYREGVDYHIELESRKKPD